jgi:hypothetical protein
MGEIADQKRLLFLLAICLLSLTVLTWSINRRNRQKTVPIVLNTNPQTAKLAEPDLKTEIPPLAVPEYSNWYISEKYQTPITNSGRRDPFAKLPAEKRLEAEMTVTPQEYVEIPAFTPEVGSSDSLHLRGVLLGNKPIAYLEAPGGGEYRRVTIGDTVSGGIIENITEKSVTINHNGNRVILNLGE